MTADHSSFRRTVIDVARNDYDATLPPMAFDRILARRAKGDTVLLPAADERPQGARRSLRVAVITGALLAVAGAAAAIPGSPLATLFRSPPPAAPVVPAVTIPMSGVAIPLAGDRSAWVEMDSVPPEVRIRVRLVDAPLLEVRGSGSAAAAEFRPRAGGIGVAMLGGRAGEVQVDVPRGAERFVLRVAGREYVVKEGARLRVLMSADTMGAELVFSPGTQP